MELVMKLFDPSEYRWLTRLIVVALLLANVPSNLRDVIWYNFRVTLNEENVDQLSAYIGGAPRVWFFYDVSPTDGYWRADLIREWFASNGYRETVYREVFQNTAPLLMRYDRIGIQ